MIVFVWKCDVENYECFIDPNDILLYNVAEMHCKGKKLEGFVKYFPFVINFSISLEDISIMVL